MSSATNFFERQDDARRNTSWLVALFAVAVVLVILALSVPLFLNGRVQEGLVVGGVVGAGLDHKHSGLLPTTMLLLRWSSPMDHSDYRNHV